MAGAHKLTLSHDGTVAQTTGERGIWVKQVSMFTLDTTIDKYAPQAGSHGNLVGAIVAAQAVPAAHLL